MGHVMVPGFPQAASQAQLWVNELAAELRWNERRAWRLLKSVLRALRDFLPPAEMADLAAQLPVLLRGACFEGWRPGAQIGEKRSRQDFLARIDAEFANDRLPDAEEAIRAVFRLLERHVSVGEIEQVRHSLRKSMRELWPEH
jgi:uncharacterized protein (DUF2267 family)